MKQPAHFDEDRATTLRVPRKGWIVGVALAGLYATANALGCVYSIVHLRAMESLLSFLHVVAGVWFALGAWRRTPWGYGFDFSIAPPEPNSLTQRRARAYTAGVAACAAAVVGALAYQWFARR